MGFTFLATLFGAVNCILLGVVIFILKQPDPERGKMRQEFQDLHIRLAELDKNLVSLEQKFEQTIVASQTEQVAKLERLSQDMGRRLQDIHDNL